MQYHDKTGNLLRHFEYLRGQLVNTIRCTEMRGLDPAPDNRAAQPKCYEVLTWERECITTFTQYGSFTECGEWFLVGSYMIGNCFPAEQGTGGNNAPVYNPISEDGLSCGSFEFRATTALWQEAGIRNSKVRILWLAGKKTGQYIDATITGPIVYGLPLKRYNGITITPGMAAQVAAQASTQAYRSTKLLLENAPFKPTASQIEQTYREQVHLAMVKFAGTAGRTGTGSPNIVFRDAQYTFLGNGNCN